jgi:hypothetical protein
MTDDITRVGGGLGNAPDGLPDDMLDDADLELITDYLTNQLPAERVAEVARRLDEDEAFRKLAAPLVLAWSIPLSAKREAMPRAELEAMWDDFTRRVGFVQQRRKARWRPLRLIGGLFALFVFWLVAPFVVYDAGPEGIAQPEQFVPVADSGGWMSLGKARVKLDAGARLRRGKDTKGYSNLVKLEGSARFVHLPPSGVSFMPDGPPFTVLTDAGIIVGSNADFRVNARTDTTEVEVLWRESDSKKATASQTDSRAQIPDHVVLTGMDGPVAVLVLASGEIGRLQSGKKPVKVREVPTDAFGDDPIIKALLKGGFPTIPPRSTP